MVEGAPTAEQPHAAEVQRLAGESAALARRLADDTERGRRLPDELVQMLGAAGLLRAGAPAEVDGLELPAGIALGCAEEVARGDASAGWCVSIAITSSLLVAYLPAGAREELFGGGRGIAAGVWAPRGKARAVDGGVVVSGRWPFCSGIDHADLLFAGCFVESKAGSAEGPRAPSVVAIPKGDLEILDTWHTLGLRGTGSHDAVAEDVFVPEARVLSVFEGPLVDRPVYRFPVFGFFALSIAAAAIGNARAAIDDLVELAVGKVGQGSSRTLAERSPTQAAVAAAEGSLRAARAYVADAIEAAWQAAQASEPVSIERRTDLRLAATHATRTAAEVVRSMYDLGGGSAIYDDSPLQRRFRDAYTATAHFQVNEASRELPGRILLDLPSETPTL